MKKAVLFMMLVLAAVSLRADEAAQPVSETVITSDKLTFDYDDHFARFEGHVFVDDAQMQLRCDKLTVRFEESGKVSWLEAEGAVNIIQEDRRALAEKVTHDVESGEFVLTGSPKVYRGEDVLQGETIRFWRGENRVVSEPRARLTIHIGNDKAGDTILRGK